MSSASPHFLDLASALRSYRERRVITQLELARELEIPIRSLQDYEAGDAMPRPERRRKIIAFLAAEEMAAA